MTPTIVFDFDGTLALGDGPILAFARAIAERTGDATFVERAEAALAAFGRGETGIRDGYDAVTRLAVADGHGRDVLDAAYEASRALLGSDHAAVAPPAGLAAFLDRVGARARLVLATNAPGESVMTVLDGWGVTAAFDALHFTVGKPDGLVPVLREALAAGPVLSVGDIVEFDLAPAAALGAATALVGATAERADAAVTMRARSVADLYDRILDWADAARTDAADLSLPSAENPTSTERH